MNRVIHISLYIFTILLSVFGVIFNLVVTNDAGWAAIFGIIAGFNVAELLSLWMG